MTILAKELLTGNGLFSEDYAHLAESCYELWTTPTDLTALQVADGLTMLDVFQFARILRFHAVLRLRSLQKLKDINYATYLRSVIGGNDYNDLKANLISHGADEQKAEAFLKFWIWNAGGGSGHLDLQYTPMVRLGDTVAVLYACQLNSNLFRNTLLRSKQRPYSDGSKDPLSDELVGALLEKTGTAQSRVKYKYGAETGDLDVVALIGETLFVFECKNTVLPCSAFEQRTLFDYLEKAGEQLDRFVALWSDGEFRKYLGAKLGWDLSIASLETAIVPSIRLLSGIHYFGHPVRHLREMANLIRTGRGQLSYSGESIEIDFWSGQPFSDERLRDYLSPSNSVYEPLWRSAVKGFDEYGTKRWRTKVAKFYFSPETYAELLKNEFGVLVV
jgi:hypothetical protein